MTLFRLPDSFSARLSFYLAMEEYIADEYGSGFFLWRVAPTVIIGRNQDLEAEVNLDYCRQRGIDIVRRRSGGGAVYADEGNLMISCITPGRDVEAAFASYLDGLASVLRSRGLDAVRTEHNDVTVAGRKVSGNACSVRGASTIVHGTLLFDVNLQVMQLSLRPPVEKLARHGVASVRSRVENLSALAPDLDPEDMEKALCNAFCSKSRLLGQEEIGRVQASEQEFRTLDFILGKAH